VYQGACELTVDAEGELNCISDGPGPYAGGDYCIFRATSTIRLSVLEFDLRPQYDQISVTSASTTSASGVGRNSYYGVGGSYYYYGGYGGNYYTGTAGPQDLMMSAGDTIEWYAYAGAGANQGFVICGIAPPPPPFPSVPPFPPLPENAVIVELPRVHAKFEMVPFNDTVVNGSGATQHFLAALRLLANCEVNRCEVEVQSVLGSARIYGRFQPITDMVATLSWQDVNRTENCPPPSPSPSPSPSPPPCVSRQDEALDHLYAENLRQRIWLDVFRQRLGELSNDTDPLLSQFELGIQEYE